MSNRMRNACRSIFLFAILASRVLAAEPPRRAELAEQFSEMLTTQCQEILASRSKLLKDKEYPMWTACYVKIEDGKATILASVSARLDQLGADSILYSINDRAEIRVRNIYWYKDGGKHHVEAVCDYVEFGVEQPPGNARTDSRGSTRIDLPLDLGQAVNLSGVRDVRKGPRSMNGTGLVILWQ